VRASRSPADKAATLRPPRKQARPAEGHIAVITIGDNPPTWGEVDSALNSLAGPPSFAPYARFGHAGTEVTLVPATLEDGARMQVTLEHIIREHVEVSAYISAWHDGPGAVTVILATRGGADMDRILDAVSLAPAGSGAEHDPQRLALPPRPAAGSRRPRPGPGRSRPAHGGHSPAGG
jgi:hypothetical protein